MIAVLLPPADLARELGRIYGEFRCLHPSGGPELELSRYLAQRGSHLLDALPEAGAMLSFGATGDCNPILLELLRSMVPNVKLPPAPDSKEELERLLAEAKELERSARSCSVVASVLDVVTALLGAEAIQ
jgi:hypothetical protein